MWPTCPHHQRIERHTGSIPVDTNEISNVMVTVNHHTHLLSICCDVRSLARSSRSTGSPSYRFDLLSLHLQIVVSVCRMSTDIRCLTGRDILRKWWNTVGGINRLGSPCPMPHPAREQRFHTLDGYRLGFGHPNVCENAMQPSARLQRSHLRAGSRSREAECRKEKEHPVWAHRRSDHVWENFGENELTPVSKAGSHDEDIH